MQNFGFKSGLLISTFAVLISFIFAYIVLIFALYSSSEIRPLIFIGRFCPPIIFIILNSLLIKIMPAMRNGLQWGFLWLAILIPWFFWDLYVYVVYSMGLDWVI